MNPTAESPNGNTPEDHEVGDWIERAGPRPAMPAEHFASVRDAFRAEWLAQLAARRRARALRRWAVAACLLTTAGLAAWWGLQRRAPNPPLGAPVARVEAVYGQLPGSVVAGQPVTSGETVTTGEGEAATRVTLRLLAGPALRLDVGSRVRFLGAREFELLQGAVYVDSGGADDPALTLTTAFGVARDIGTRFEARLLPAPDAALRIRVRDGRVEVVTPGQRAARQAAAGAELLVAAEGDIRRAPVALHGPEWEWVLATAPPFEIEGRTLGQLLTWVMEETGWQVAFVPPELATPARAIELHGALGRLGPAEAPAAVLPGAGLDHQLIDGVLTLRRAAPPPPL